MSDAIEDFTTTLSINGQNIEVQTKVQKDMKKVIYELASQKEISPQVVAVALYLMCHDICEELEMDVSEIAEGIIDESNDADNIH